MYELRIILIFNDVSVSSKANCCQVGRKTAFSWAEFFFKRNEKKQKVKIKVTRKHS